MATGLGPGRSGVLGFRYFDFSQPSGFSPRMVSSADIAGRTLFEHFAEQGIPEGEDERTTWQVRLPLREGLTYWWRARASDGPFHSEYSEPRSFTVNSFPEPPGLPEGPPRGASPGEAASRTG